MKYALLTAALATASSAAVVARAPAVDAASAPAEALPSTKEAFVDKECSEKLSEYPSLSECQRINRKLYGFTKTACEKIVKENSTYSQTCDQVALKEVKGWKVDLEYLLDDFVEFELKVGKEATDARVSYAKSQCPSEKGQKRSCYGDESWKFIRMYRSCSGAEQSYNMTETQCQADLIAKPQETMTRIDNALLEAERVEEERKRVEKAERQAKEEELQRQAEAFANTECSGRDAGSDPDCRPYHEQLFQESRKFCAQRKLEGPECHNGFAQLAEKAKSSGQKWQRWEFWPRIVDELREPNFVNTPEKLMLETGYAHSVLCVVSNTNSSALECQTTPGMGPCNDCKTIVEQCDANGGCPLCDGSSMFHKSTEYSTRMGKREWKVYSFTCSLNGKAAKTTIEENEGDLQNLAESRVARNTREGNQEDLDSKYDPHNGLIFAV